MRNDQLIKENRQIAGFMGLIPHVAGDQYGEPWYELPGLKGKFFRYESQLSYNSDWNWLMPVVEKILNIKDEHGEPEYPTP